MSRIDFFRHNDHRDRRFGAGKRARNHFKCDEGALVRCDRDKRRENRVAEDGVKQQAAAAEDVGEGRHKQREQVAEPNYREHRAEMRFRDLESGLDLLERETQQRAVVLIEKSRG